MVGVNRTDRLYALVEEPRPLRREDLDIPPDKLLRFALD